MQSMAQQQAYAHYLKDVLGVKSILMPSAFETAEGFNPQEQLLSSIKSQPLVIFVDHGEVNLMADAEALVLFEKMRKAMNLSLVDSEMKHFASLEEMQVGLAAFEGICVLFVDSEDEFKASDFGQILALNGFTLLKTFHPKILLEKIELKKAAWDHLKLVMKTLAEKKQWVSYEDYF